ncbi:MAG: cobalamin-dependent protein, partial [Deltaproteobacteria bacterium]|nr:cobalamin-dependent protein [Deltaproteobacteria bacterium]
MAETVYAALLFPERKAQIEKVFYREAKGKPRLRGVDFAALASQVSHASDDFIESVEWGRCGLVGFSVALCQLTSSLYFITRIKKAFPNLPIVVGGSTFGGDALRGLLETFPEIDAVVNGEGELPMSQLISHLMNSKSFDKMPPIPGVVTRKTMKDRTPAPFHQMASLSNLPAPDYDDYFHLLNTFS